MLHIKRKKTKPKYILNKIRYAKLNSFSSKKIILIKIIIYKIHVIKKQGVQKFTQNQFHY